MKRSSIRQGWLTLIFLFGVISLTTSQSTRPNIIYIIADDVGWGDLGCYGSNVAQTPNIDKLAREGIKFENAFLTASSCSPSRCSIITGRYPHNTGAAELHFPLPESQIPFPLLLKNAGYYSVQAGKSHFGEAALRCFDHAYEMEDAGVGGEERWVRCLQERPKDKPIFAWFAAIDAHRDWQFDDKGTTPALDAIQVPPFLVDCEQTRQDLAAYHHEISRWDYYVGEVIKELERQGILDNTVVIIMSDNGMPFPRAKTRVYDSGMKTPLIIKWKGKIPSGTESNSLVSAVDIAPTIIDIAGVDMPEYFQGRSFARLFVAPDLPFRRFVYAEHNWHDYEAHERMIRSQTFMYVRNNRPQLTNGGPADSKRSLSQAALDSVKLAGKLTAAQLDNYIAPRAHEELFQVSRDPVQLLNLASAEFFLDTLQYFRDQLDIWVSETGDNVPEDLTPDGFDRTTGELLPGIPAFNKVPRGEMPGIKSGALSSNSKPGFYK
ncbi:MAG: sulfatase [Saprospiraceae bacterium]|nr:sulfatase [Saprospiraceae bacterium]